MQCNECQQFLDETKTCFVREGKTYCKADYMKLFGYKCEKCHQSFKKEDYVMRANNKIFHQEESHLTLEFRSKLFHISYNQSLILLRE